MLLDIIKILSISIFINIYFCLAVYANNVPFNIDTFESTSLENNITQNSAIKIPKNLAIPFRINGSYNTRTLTTQTRIPIVVDSDVYFLETLVFKKGTVGYLYASDVLPAGRYRKLAFIKIDNAHIMDIKGFEHILAVNYQTEGKDVVYSWSSGLAARNKDIELNNILLYGYITEPFYLK